MKILFLTFTWTMAPQQKELQSTVMSISPVTISIIPVTEIVASILVDLLRAIKTSERMFYQMSGSMKAKSWHHAPDCQAGVCPVPGPPSRICQRINETEIVNLAIRHSNSCWNRKSIHPHENMLRHNFKTSAVRSGAHLAQDINQLLKQRNRTPSKHCPVTANQRPILAHWVINSRKA